MTNWKFIVVVLLIYYDGLIIKRLDKPNFLYK